MSKFDFIKDGEIGLVTTDNGSIIQLRVTKEMHQTLIAPFSKESPLVKLGEKFNLVLKSTVKTFKK